ncbi:MAG: lytic murein transglycosylase [Burkholderiales bacterium]|nr:lytic murein transglycosylase [Burkholderiales bacterium]
MRVERLLLRPLPIHQEQPTLRVAIVFVSFILTLSGPAAAADASIDELRACLGQIRPEAMKKGVRAQTFDGALAAIEPDPSVLEAMSFQPEFRVPIWDYLAGLVDEQRIADGRAKLHEWEATLAKAERQFGVDRYTIVALWGVESDYGRVMGTRPLLRSLATTACFGSRSGFFRSELIDTLRIVQGGELAPDLLTGSWAGAFGQTQFMPSTYLRIAVDFDGDGRRDIVASVPDALGSTANYLRRAGWVTGAPWGYEVRLPAGYSGPSGRRQKQSVAQWSALGIRRLDGADLGTEGSAALLLPAGAAGPAFLVFKNYDAIYSYNAAESYALAIAHLSDRLRGAGAFKTPWPTDDRGLSRAERREVQAHLLGLGFDIGHADGMIGSKTRSAIRSYQAVNGMSVDGRAGGRLLEHLRKAIQGRTTTDAPDTGLCAASGPGAPAGCSRPN